VFAGKKSAQIREILISESAWEEMTCLFAPSLKLEAATSHFINVVTVAGKNQKAQFAKDIIDGYHSAEFKKYILSHPQYDGYLLPDYLK
ncbi:hypothetical protein AI2893V1_2737, partial [Klebsiella pneumoniae]